MIESTVSVVEHIFYDIKLFIECRRNRRATTCANSRSQLLMSLNVPLGLKMQSRLSIVDVFASKLNPMFLRIVFDPTLTLRVAPTFRDL